MDKNIKRRIKLKYILENIYFEILLLYIVLIFAVGMPLLRGIIVGVARLPIISLLVRMLERIELKRIVRFLISVEVMAMFSLILMLIIILIIVIIRLKRRIFLKTLLLYNIFKNYNNDFKIYTGVVFPIILSVVYFLNYFFHYSFTYKNPIRLIIVLIITISLLNYAEQISIIMHNIKNIGSREKYYIEAGCPSLFTKESVRMLDNIDEDVQISIDGQLKSERLKTELITNISHDLKTPLTSIINYTDLLKSQDFQDNTILNYVNALDRNSQRLKLLITDIVEASKTETGNVNIHLEKLELNELISQVYGEFDTVFNEKNISFIFNPENDIFVLADGNHLGRVLENIIGNASKYTLENTRIYGLVKEEDDFVSFSLKNISKDELNISPDELMEQFVRGERSRHTEGSGLGLYIATNLMRLMNGELLLTINGDLLDIKLLIPKANK
ncbi:sensor histidine kinase [Alkaliphilus sp. B6464]|uniref:sensor histidine kinase n=1 Tax=Alkaliphilus sp. B6464 TaxID=2731219 RepID=UPI001BAAFA72|nr:HAMP domain-containing sensor histidine kinase [Alkaliphilus sp. B6464]QUH19335.1 HAMP domain-containing histidine kinase [Alkaliphilus sp. B6464]